MGTQLLYEEQLQLDLNRLRLLFTSFTKANINLKVRVVINESVLKCRQCQGPKTMISLIFQSISVSGVNLKSSIV